jgi:hypothetical protein
MNVLCARLFGAACLLAGILQADCALAAPEFACAQVTPSTVMAPPYGRDKESNVCEGFYEKAVSAPFIELVSLTLVSPDVMKAISSPKIVISTAPAARGSWRLLVQPLSVAMPYRVDAVLSSAAPLKWDFARMGAATRTTLKDVGFVAMASGGTDASTVVPIRISAAGDPARDIPKVAYATVRVTGTTSKVMWRSYATDPTERSGTLSWVSVGSEPLYPEDWATIEIPLTGGKGGLTIEFKGIDVDSNEIHPLRIVIPGSGS